MYVLSIHFDSLYYLILLDLATKIELLLYWQPSLKMVTLYNENIKKEEQQMSKNNLIQETKNKSNVLETI